MITPEELRIGNWLQLEGKPVQVGSIDPLRELPERNLKCSVQIKEWLTDKHYTYTGKWLSRFEPISIDTELRKFGFYRRIGSGVYQLVIDHIDSEFPCTLQQSEDGFQICRSGIGAVTAPVKYVHQLQNLYYALTGKEIELKEPIEK